MAEITNEQLKQMRLLIKNECCNWDNGNCAILDDGEYHKCPQITDNTLHCMWFTEAVLPLNSVLEAQLLHPDTGKVKRCICGKLFIPTNNKSKYCETCAKKMRRKQHAECERKRRSLVDK